jgi:hypothetical protein
MFMPLALVAPALVLFYLVGSSYTWVFAWCCFWMGAVGTQREGSLGMVCLRLPMGVRVIVCEH